MAGYLTTQLQTAETRAAAIRQRERFQETYGELIAGLPPGPVLDIGPGRGELLDVLSLDKGSSGTDVQAIDIDREVVDHLRENYPGVTVIHGEPTAFLNNSEVQFSAVFMLHVLEHLETDYAVELLQAVRQCLAPGGVLVIEVPNSAATFVGNTIYSSDITHKRPYTSVSLKQICRLAGFEDIQLRGIRPKVTSLARLIQRSATATLIALDKLAHKLFLPSWQFMHEPTIYAICSIPPETRR